MTFERTGNSANIVFYGERPQRPGYTWVEVLSSAIEQIDGKWRKRRRPIYYGTIYRYRVGEVGKFKYEPSRRPAGGELSPRTVARLVKEAATTREP